MNGKNHEWFVFSMNNTVQYWGRNIGYVYLRKTGSDAIDLICNGGSKRGTILVIQQGR